MRLIVLGSGTSFGVPVIGCTCGTCTSTDPRDQRTRVGAMIESDSGARILIDTPPELRLQLLRARVGSVDAVLFTHEHADHLHGIDDLRAISGRRSGALPIYGPRRTMDALRERFRYIFDDVAPPSGTTKPELSTWAMEPYRESTVSGVTVLPIALDHGGLDVYGYRIGALAYLTDVKEVSDEAIRCLRGVRLLVLNALFEHSHPTHLSIPEAIEVASIVGAERTILTHLTHRFTHAELVRRLPERVEPAYDGLTVPF